ncbi:MAG: hypothetical protein HOP02_01025 [Methylococcaceae bacterium]|nr:hypothetical protein [Methylococcaceae bacterium]
MKNFNLSTLALGLGLILCTDVMADSLSKKQYKAQAKTIAADYKAADAVCDTLSGNAEDICEATAKGNRNVAKTALEEKYHPSVKTHYKARVANADAVYAVAIEKCDDKAGNDKDICVKEVRAAKIQEESFAEAEMKTTKADAVAIEKTTDARQEAVSDTRDANYAVAKEKCAALVGQAKESCLGDAKIHFGL